jgi:hypothetical protein
MRYRVQGFFCGLLDTVSAKPLPIIGMPERIMETDVWMILAWPICSIKNPTWPDQSIPLG